MGWIVAMVGLSLVMTGLAVAELRRPLRASGITIVDGVITVLVLGTFTLAIVNGLILIAAKALP